MDFDNNSRKFESVFSHKVRAGKRRTYFFDVKKTKGNDYYITLTESTKRFNGDGYERHKIFLYKEDFNRFLDGLQETIGHIKTELMPDYDYDEYTRRNQEWEARRLEEAASGSGVSAEETETKIESMETPVSETSAEESAEEETSDDTEEDISW